MNLNNNAQCAGLGLSVGRTVKRAIGAGTLAVAAVGSVGLAAGAASVGVGTASAATVVRVLGDESTKFSCDMDRRKDIAIYNLDGAGYFYGDCVQAPNSALNGHETEPGRWYFTLQRR